MGTIFDVESWYVAISFWLQKASDGLGVFLPKLLLALVVFGAGWILAKFVQAIARRLLRKTGIDHLPASSRIAESLGHDGAALPLSDLCAGVLFWAILLTFALFSLQTLGMQAVATTLEKVMIYLPNIFAGIVILLVGIPLGRLVKGLTASAAAAANIVQGPKLGTAAQAATILVIVVLALGQLGIDTNLLIIIITTVIGTIGFSMGLAFALGAKPIVTHILAGHFLRQNLARGTSVGVLGKTGQVRSVGAVSTVLAAGDREWIVPNEKMMNEVLGR